MISIEFETDSETLIIDSNYVTQLTQEANLFSGETFYIGSTVCRAFTLSVDRRALHGEMPYAVTIYDNGNPYADLVVDSIDDSDASVYTFHLTDRMVRLNEQSDVWFEQGATLYEQLENIGVRYNIGIQEQLPAYDDMEISWYNNWTAREFVSWVAELLGGYAYISNDNFLIFSPYWKVPQYTINVADCDSFKLGEQITIDRVVYDTPEKTVICPENYSGTGCTLYLNTDNELFTDSGNITIESQVEYIYNKVNGFSFYNVEVGKCPINPAVRAGTIVGFVLDGNTYPTIAQVNWNYNTMWIGGYSLHLDSPVQAETQIQSPIVKMGYTISQKIDREVGEVRTEITGVQNSLEGEINSVSSSLTQTASALSSEISNVRTGVNDNSEAIEAVRSSITQTANDLTLQFESSVGAVQENVDGLQTQVNNNSNEINTLKTSVIVDSSGVTVKKSNSTVRGVFGNTELDFIDNSSGSDVTQAWIGKDGLGGREINIGDPNTASRQWRIITSSDGSHLRFTRHS